MAERNFRDLLGARFVKGLLLCVGLDSEFEQIPEAARQNNVRETLVGFNRAIIDATKDLVCAYKPNSAFYEAHGDLGFLALRETIQYIHEVAPEVPVILDAKRGDIGHTNRGYVEAVFDYLHADAVTIHPYLGKEGAAPFLEREEKGIIVLCRTSNRGATEFQDLDVDGKPLYQHIARHVATEWNERGNCGLVVGATYPEELKEVRSLAPDVPILLPGVGAQNGDLIKSVRAGIDAKNGGLIVSSSRAVIFASSGADFADKAREKALELNGDIKNALIQ